MARVPAAGAMTTSPKDPEVLMAEEEQRRKAVEQMAGAVAEVTYTIAAGAIKPTTGCFAVDTEGAAASDDLDKLTGENDVTLGGFPQHGVVILRAANAARTVNVRHLAGGPWDLSLRDASPFALDDDAKCLVLQLRGQRWFEVLRSYGSDAAAERAVLGVTKLATLPDPANPGDDGKYVGASAGNLAYTAAPPGGDGFLEHFQMYKGNDKTYLSGNPIGWNIAESGADPVTDGFTFEAPAGAQFAVVKAHVWGNRTDAMATHDFMTLAVASRRPLGSGLYGIDATGVFGSRGCAAKTVMFRPNSESDREPDVFLEVASLFVPLWPVAGAIRVHINGIAGRGYNVGGSTGPKTKAWVAVTWM